MTDICENITLETVYGIAVYTIKTDVDVTYQLTFQEDLYKPRVNVALLPIVDYAGKYSIDLRKKVYKCFIDYLEGNLNQALYFEINNYTLEGRAVLSKFLRWIIPYKDYINVSIVYTKTDALKYTALTLRCIKQIPKLED